LQPQYDKIREIYRNLYQQFGPQGWWPADNRFEVIVGAILTQAISWQNVEKALQSLQAANLMSESGLLSAPPDDLAGVIRPALYHHQKAKKLKIMMHFIINEYQGDYDLMFSEPMDILRTRLLSLWGIGKETADSILLYAGNYPIFVVDAYTRRIFSRIGLVGEDISYQEMQDYIHNHLDTSVDLYNEFHALLVRLGAEYCKKRRPKCKECPVAEICRQSANMEE